MTASHLPSSTVQPCTGGQGLALDPKYRQDLLPVSFAAPV